MRHRQSASSVLGRAILIGKPRVILTGPRKVGKSTLVRAVLAQGHPAWGYLSSPVCSEGTRGYDAWLLPGWQRVPYARDAWKRGIRVGPWYFRPEVFSQVLAPHLLGSRRPKHLLVLDELGLAERRCRPFRDAVKTCFDTAGSILAVVQLRALPYWLPILLGADLPLIYISENNRSEWQQILTDLFGRGSRSAQMLDSPTLPLKTTGRGKPETLAR